MEIEEEKKRRIRLANTEAQRRRRQQATPEELERRRKAQAEAQRRRRQQATPDEITRRRKAEAEAQRLRRKRATPEELARKRKAEADAKRRKLRNITPQQAADLRKANAASHRRRKETETPEIASKRRKAHAAVQRRHHEIATKEQRAMMKKGMVQLSQKRMGSSVKGLSIFRVNLLRESTRLFSNLRKGHVKLESIIQARRQKRLRLRQLFMQIRLKNATSVQKSKLRLLLRKQRKKANKADIWKKQIAAHTNFVIQGAKATNCSDVGTGKWKTKCPICLKYFYKSTIPIHMLSHLPKGAQPFQCKICQRGFNTHNAYKEHHKRLHASVDPPMTLSTFCCFVCSACVETRVKFLSHLKNHVESKELDDISVTKEMLFFQCDAQGCSMCFRDKIHLDNHIISDHPNSNICHICDKCFATPSNYNTHAQDAHQPDRLTIACAYCCQILAQDEVERHRKNHILILGEGSTPAVVCDECGKSFTNTRNLEAHHKRVHPTVSLSCQICTESFKTTKALERHCLNDHTYEHPLVCYVCSKEFRFLYLLNSHIRRIHQGKNRSCTYHDCSYCTKTFSFHILRNQHHVLAHAKPHLLYKPFYCTVCYRAFQHQNELDRHILIHEKFKCGVCNMYHYCRKNLDEHLQTHAKGRSKKQIDSVAAQVAQRKIFVETKLREVGTLFDQPVFKQGKQVLDLVLESRKRELVMIRGPWSTTRKRVSKKPKNLNSNIPAKRGQHDERQKNKQDIEIPTEVLELLEERVQLRFQCDQCPAQFNTPATFVLHLKWHDAHKSGNLTDLYKDGVLAETSSEINEEALRTLQKKYGNPNAVIYKCEKCSDTFYTERQWSCHKRDHDLQTILKPPNSTAQAQLMANCVPRQMANNERMEKISRMHLRRSDTSKATGGVSTLCEDGSTHGNPDDEDSFADPLARTRHDMVTSKIDSFSTKNATPTNNTPIPQILFINSITTERVNFNFESSLETNKASATEVSLLKTENTWNDIFYPTLESQRTLNSVVYRINSLHSLLPSELREKASALPLLVIETAQLTEHEIATKCVQDYPEPKIETPDSDYFGVIPFLPNDHFHEYYHSEVSQDLPHSSQAPQVGNELNGHILKVQKSRHLRGNSALKKRSSQNVLKGQKTKECCQTNSRNKRIPRKSAKRGLSRLRSIFGITTNGANSECEESAEVRNMSSPHSAAGLSMLSDSMASGRQKKRSKKGANPRSMQKDSRLNITEKLQLNAEFQCASCDKSFYSKRSYKDHIRFHPNSSGLFPCKECNTIFGTSNDLQKHLRQNHLKQCPVCKKRLPASQDLKSHMERHSADAETFTCPVCSKKYNIFDSLRYHMRRSHGQNIFDFPSRNYHCHICLKTLDSKKRFIRHLHSHLNVLDLTSKFFIYDCDAEKCRLSFIHKETFQRHLETHSDILHSSLACQPCCKIFASAASFDSHVLTVHQENKISCEYCIISYDHHTLLQGHVRSVHEIDLERPLTGDFMCDVCGKSFTLQRSLESHKLLHIENLSEIVASLDHEKVKTLLLPRRKEFGAKVHNNKKGKCPICGQAMGIRRALNNHLLMKHTYEHGLRCFVCSKHFQRYGRLVTHLETHAKCGAVSPHTLLPGTPATAFVQKQTSKSGEKRAKKRCIYCYYVFSDNLREYKHYFYYHREQYLENSPFYCPHCYKTYSSLNELETHQTISHDHLKCQDCGKQFLRNDLFQAHELSHRVDRTVQCGLCNKAFDDMDNLRRHADLIHRRERFIAVGHPGIKWQQQDDKIGAPSFEAREDNLLCPQQSCTETQHVIDSQFQKQGDLKTVIALPPHSMQLHFAPNS